MSKTARRLQEDGCKKTASQPLGASPAVLHPYPITASPYHLTPPSSVAPARMTALTPVPPWSRCAMDVPLASTAIPIIPSPEAGSARKCALIWIASTLRPAALPAAPCRSEGERRVGPHLLG